MQSQNLQDDIGRKTAVSFGALHSKHAAVDTVCGRKKDEKRDSYIDASSTSTGNRVYQAPQFLAPA